MQFSSNNIKELVSSFIPFIKKIIKTECKTYIQSVNAQIISIDNCQYTVRAAGSPDDGEHDFVVNNRFGYRFNIGDFVQLQYYDTYTNAYIAGPVNKNEQNMSFTITLESDAWNDSQQIIVDDRFLSGDHAYMITPSPANVAAYSASGIYAEDIQDDGQIIFRYMNKLPSQNLTVNILKVN